MVTLAWPPRVIAFVLSIPTALAGFFVYKLAWIMFDALPARERAVAVACAVAIGTTSAMGLGALAVTMNEWPLAMLVTFALWWLVRAQDAQGSISRSALVVAGLSMGVATGAKLTAAPFALAMGIALLVRPRRLRVVEASWFAAGAACGFAVAYGAWGYALWTHFRNPIFPYANSWFQSPWWEAKAVPGRTSGRKPRSPTSGIPSRCGPAAALRRRDAVSRRPRPARVGTCDRCRYRMDVPPPPRRGASPSAPAWHLIAWFFGVSSSCGPRRSPSIATCCHSMRFAASQSAAWCSARARTRGRGGVRRVRGRARRDDAHRPTGAGCRSATGGFEAKSMPIVEPNALVLITTGEAVSYYIPMLPSTSRYVGALNTAVNPSQPSALAQDVRDIVTRHEGYTYQMTHPLRAGEEVLAGYGLMRTTACAVVVTNMPVSPIEFCLLLRIDD
jgi:hypothetical protein